MGRRPKELPGATELAAEGLTASQIAKRLEVSNATVVYWAQRHRVTLSKYTRQPNPRALAAIALAQAGLYMAEIARQTGYTDCGVKLILKRNGIKPGRKPKDLRNSPRAEQMAAMYRQGLTLEKIGQHFGLTRERARQILAKQGIRREHGGQCRVKESRMETKLSKRNAASLTRWGISYAEMKACRADGTLAAFTSQRNSAASRGVAWSLTFKHWLSVWTESGKLDQRGRGIGHYVMSRIKDEGGYAVGNVHVQLSTDNNRQGLAKARLNVARNTGVWLILPGTSKPWQAAVGHKKLGNFATEDDAVAARAAYIEAHPPTRGRGYTVVKGKTTRYQVMVGSRYIGTYKTPEDALAARHAALLASLPQTSLHPRHAQPRQALHSSSMCANPAPP